MSNTQQCLSQGQSPLNKESPLNRRFRPLGLSIKGCESFNDLLQKRRTYLDSVSLDASIESKSILNEKQEMQNFCEDIKKIFNNTQQQIPAQVFSPLSKHVSMKNINLNDTFQKNEGPRRQKTMVENQQQHDSKEYDKYHQRMVSHQKTSKKLTKKYSYQRESISKNEVEQKQLMIQINLLKEQGKHIDQKQEFLPYQGRRMVNMIESSKFQPLQIRKGRKKKNIMKKKDSQDRIPQISQFIDSLNDLDEDQDLDHFLQNMNKSSESSSESVRPTSNKVNSVDQSALVELEETEKLSSFQQIDPQILLKSLRKMSTCRQSIQDAV